MMPAFTDPTAAQRWKAYFDRVDRLLAIAEPMAADMREELVAHLSESYASSVERGEDARLRDAIKRLGDPEDYLRLLIADGLIDRATARLDPIGVARGLYHAVRLGSARMVVGVAFGLGYVALLVFLGMAVLRPLWGGHVGLYRWPDGTVQFGFLKDTSGATDILGSWTLPVAIAASALVYLLLTKGLRRIWRKL